MNIKSKLNLCVFLLSSFVLNAYADKTSQLTLSASEAASDESLQTSSLRQTRYMLGVDISSIPELNDFNVWFVDTDGVGGKSMLQILKNHGVNYIRLRTFVNPWAQFGYAAQDSECPGRAEAYNDKAHTVAFAKAIKEMGFGLLLDFHYSDTWADPSKQIIPEAWRGITTVDGMANQVRSYTTEVLTALEDAGALPDMVQVGNEITGGILSHLPTQQSSCWGGNLTVSPIAGDYNNWDNLAKYLKAGVAGVKAVSDDIKIMMHIENTQSINGMKWWLENALNRKVEFDVLGLSAYEPIHGPASAWPDIINTMANLYPQLEFVFAEYNQGITSTNKIMLELPNERGLGTFFWEPTQSGFWGEGIFSWNGNSAYAIPERFSEFDNLSNQYNID